MSVDSRNLMATIVTILLSLATGSLYITYLLIKYLCKE